MGACGNDDAPKPSLPPSGATRWVKTDLRTARVEEIRLAAVRLAHLCKAEAKSGVGVGVTGAVVIAANSRSLADAMATRLACALDAPRAATCDDIRACSGLTADRPVAPVCDSQTLIGPDARSPGALSVACSAFGQSCFTTAVGALCGVAPCADGETYACSKDSVIACVQGVRTVTPCGQGMTCGEQDGTRMIDCVGKGAACSGTDRCDGEVAVSCIRNSSGSGKEARVDCAAWGLGCQVLGDNAQCIPKAAECAVGKDVARCKGAALEMCVASKWWSVKCSSVSSGSACKDGAGFGGEAACQ